MKKDLKEIEIDCLLHAIYDCYGYDFNNYARASLTRRIQNCMVEAQVDNISELIPKVLHDEDFFNKYLNYMSVTVTEMFRDPDMFKSIREQVIPKLKTYSRINIWHAGCATGEEVYSMAILLAEEGLLAKTQIYATDYNNKSLEIAKTGIYPVKHMQQYTKNYIRSGGKASFSDYYWANYDSVKMSKELQKNITFAHHNLICDQVFAEMNLVLCRNVLIYFDKTLQNRVLSMFAKSIVSRGFLVLGDQETLRFSDVEKEFEVYNKEEKVYRLKKIPYV